MKNSHPSKSQFFPSIRISNEWIDLLHSSIKSLSIILFGSANPYFSYKGRTLRSQQIAKNKDNDLQLEYIYITSSR